MYRPAARLTAGVGKAGVLVLLGHTWAVALLVGTALVLITALALTAALSRRKTRRDAAHRVLRELLAAADVRPGR